MRFGFLLNEVLTGLRRNVTMTAAMILTTAISIGLFGGGLLVVRLADNSREIYLDRVETQVFLTDDISTNDATCGSAPCKALRDKIDARQDVKSVRFVNRQDAYNDAIKKFPEFKDVAGKDSFPASFIVKLNNPEQHAEFDAAMQGQPGVRSLLNEKDLIDRLFAVLDGLRNAAFAVALVQAVGAILLIANMVQVAAHTRRTEIGIMRLVGASRWYTQLPFLVEAMLAAAIGVAIAVVGLILVRAWFLDNALSQFYQAHLIAKVDYADILYISPWLFVLGVSIAGLTAYATLRLYIRR
ncbi:ABC transporter permease [Mycobacterium avium subsp. paratuberculosis]|uniref:Cell division protein FtsX n=1 Tax=Mycolicibacterium paratuberculosis (strain ATCC BAA-968 / K-10) TaxID=262316 RepID=Q73V45_MYCPA|nr:permease-like cell division protein FtsX [Mycobacterium avium]ETB05803.1 cell division protein FtsX [Mycobacterium avium subsp. paratuberculosis 10-4404]ETB07268.1 cell division protein FtsX [Mycobacterium avium subsp. paratuberculosis 10-5864]ETB35242.1 cell division protein FtsX [Mycobacterium avium subsp. paratuberculosis 10-5975]ETB48955.1 cell division protein FtsX [Mycobacterium avium subsp. paratuberculosis 10-8425]AAS05719.1 FtsX [Mycobacterium avium subsp. paratuberculosis K-10]